MSFYSLYIVYSTKKKIKKYGNSNWKIQKTWNLY